MSRTEEACLLGDDLRVVLVMEQPTRVGGRAEEPRGCEVAKNDVVRVWSRRRRCRCQRNGEESRDEGAKRHSDSEER